MILQKKSREKFWVIPQLSVGRRADNKRMTTYSTPSSKSTLSKFVAGFAASALALALAGCTEKDPDFDWRTIHIKEAGLRADLPCERLDTALVPVDFNMGLGDVAVTMMGCDAIDSTFAVSHWVLDDAKRADDALAFWQAAVLSHLKAVDGKHHRSGASFIPPGAMPLSRSIQATVQGVGPSGWTVTTEAVWFARQEGQGARIIHAVIYAPKPREKVAQRFFSSLALE